jgi:hypothetical protein
VIVVVTDTSPLNYPFQIHCDDVLTAISPQAVAGLVDGPTRTLLLRTLQLLLLRRLQILLLDSLSPTMPSSSADVGRTRSNAREVPANVRVDERGKDAMIDGLRLTISGEEMRELLEDRIEYHERCVRHWRREQARTPEEQTEGEPLLPEHMCEHEAERHGWRADVLGFIRDHIEAAEVYRLGESDLLFGELLPARPWAIEQEEFEERTRVGFQLERLTRKVGDVVPRELAIAAAQET